LRSAGIADLVGWVEVTKPNIIYTLFYFIKNRRNTPRTHVCKCGCVLDRDHNAAINILTKALRQVGYDVSTVGRTETNACGEMTLYPDLETSLLKQESPSLYRAGSVNPK